MRARTPMGGGLALGFSRGRGQAAPPPAGVPANTGVPAISGSPAVDETLSASTGSWSNSPTSFAYQWYADAVAIPGATGSTYLLTASEEGANITVGVVATNIVGDSTEAVSAAVGPVTASFAITTPVVSTADSLAGDTQPTYAIDFVDASPTGGGIGDTLEGRWGTSLVAMAAFTPESATITEGIFIDGDDPFPNLGTFSEAQALGTTIYFSFRVVRGADSSDWSNTGTLLLEDGTMDAPGLTDLTDQTASTRVWSSSFSVSGLASGAYARLTGTGPIRVGGVTVYEAGEQAQVQNGASVEFGVDTSATGGATVNNVVSNRGVAIETFSATTAGAGASWAGNTSPPAAQSVAAAVTVITFEDVPFDAGQGVVDVLNQHGTTISAVTINGVAATFEQNVNGSWTLSRWKAAVAAPGNYDVVVTRVAAGETGTVAIATGTLTGAASVPTATAFKTPGSASDPQSVGSITCPADGVIVASYYNADHPENNPVWTAGNTETCDLVAINIRLTSAYRTTTGAPSLNGWHFNWVGGLAAAYEPA